MCSLKLVCLFLANVNVRIYAVVRPSVFLSSVTFVRPAQPVEIFGNVSAPFGTLAIRWRPRKILRRSFQVNPSVGGLAKYSEGYLGAR